MNLQTSRVRVFAGKFYQARFRKIFVKAPEDFPSLITQSKNSKSTPTAVRQYVVIRNVTLTSLREPLRLKENCSYLGAVCNQVDESWQDSFCRVVELIL